MHLARSGIAVAAGFALFAVLFAVLGPSLGAVLTTLAAGLLAGYLTAKIAMAREMVHGGAAAGLVAASLVVQPVLPLPARLLVAAIAVAAITAGAWVRMQSRTIRDGISMEQRNSTSSHHPHGPDVSPRSPEVGDGGGERP